MAAISSQLRDPALIAHYILNYEEPEDTPPLDPFEKHQNSVDDIVHSRASQEKIWEQLVMKGFLLCESNQIFEGFAFIQVAAMAYNTKFPPIEDSPYIPSRTVTLYQHAKVAHLVYAIAQLFMKKISCDYDLDRCVELLNCFEDHCITLSPVLQKELPSLFVWKILITLYGTHDRLRLIKGMNRSSFQ